MLDRWFRINVLFIISGLRTSGKSQKSKIKKLGPEGVSKRFLDFQKVEGVGG